MFINAETQLKSLILIIENKYLTLNRDKNLYSTTYCELNDIDIKQHLLKEIMSQYIRIYEKDSGANPTIWEDTEK